MGRFCGIIVRVDLIEDRRTERSVESTVAVLASMLNPYKGYRLPAKPKLTVGNAVSVKVCTCSEGTEPEPRHNAGDRRQACGPI